MNQYEQRTLKNTLKRAESMHKENQELLKEYSNYLEKEESKPQTIIAWQNRIILFDKIITKPISQANKEDAEKLCDYLKNDKYSENTRSRVKSDYKTIRKWIVKSDLYPSDVVWITGKKLYDNRKQTEKTPEELPTEKEKDKLFYACMNNRDRALISLLRETGLRPKELLSLDRKHISFDETQDINMLVVPSDTKTGYRYVPFEVSKPYLLEWLSNHPQRNEENYPLWIQLAKNKGERLTYKGLEGLFSKLKKRAGLQNKKISPYSFRFSSITEKAKSGWSDQELKAYHGHKPDSKMLNVYVQMSGRDLSDRIKEFAGKKTKVDIKKPEVYIVKCPKCETENTNKDDFCKKCGKVINLAKAQNILEQKSNELDNAKKTYDLISQLINDDDKIIKLKKALELLK